MTPQQLTEEYIFAHDLREASTKIYRAATKALLKHFGPRATVQEVDHRSVLGWRRKVWNKACRSGAGTRIRIICERSGAMPSSTSW